MSTTRKCRQVGRVVGLWRYPVKSMAAEPLQEVDVSWHGLAGDRRWAFVRRRAEASGFPWLTLRERGDLNHYHPSFVRPDRPDTSPTVVRVPSGLTRDIADPALATELQVSTVQTNNRQVPGPQANGPQATSPQANGDSGETILAIKQRQGIFDTFPLSLITTQTISQLGQTIGIPLQVQRFRPNILVQAADETPFPEDGWVGRILRIGSLRMHVDKRDGRCAVVTIDPHSTERNPAILRAIARDRQGCLGVYGSTAEPGHVAMHDPVMLESSG